MLASQEVDFVCAPSAPCDGQQQEGPRSYWSGGSVASMHSYPGLFAAPLCLQTQEPSGRVHPDFRGEPEASWLSTPALGRRHQQENPFVSPAKSCPQKNSLLEAADPEIGY